MRERDRKGSNMLTSVPNGLLHTFNLGNTRIYSTLSKTSRYGPIAPFLRTCGRSAIQAWIVRTRIPTAINGYKNVRAFKNDLRTVCPSRPDSPRYIKLSQNDVADSAHLLKFVLWTVRTWTPDGPQYKIFVLWTVRTQAPDGPQFKK